MKSFLVSIPARKTVQKQRRHPEKRAALKPVSTQHITPRSITKRTCADPLPSVALPWRKHDPIRRHLCNRSFLPTAPWELSSYSRGIFINRCYDELNLSDPGLILSIMRITSRPARKSSRPIPSPPIAFFSLATSCRKKSPRSSRRRPPARQAVDHLKDKQAADPGSRFRGP